MYRNFIETDGQVRWRQLLVPRSLRVSLLQHLHAEPTASHMEVKKTQDWMMMMAYWKGWRADVALFCRWCIQCNRYRRGPVARQGERQQATATRPYTKIHVDLTGSHVRSKNDIINLLTAVDYFTKYLNLRPNPR